MFWMWVSAFFGMMTKYSRGSFVHPVPKKRRGRPLARGSHVLHTGWPGGSSGWRDCSLCSAFWLPLGSETWAQANSAAGALKSAFGFDPKITGVLMAALIGIIIIGGIKRIAQITEKFIPFMAIFYVAGSRHCADCQRRTASKRL